MGERHALAIMVFVFICVGAEPAEAYLDPVATSMLLQVLLGGSAALAVALGLVWRRIKDVFRKETQGGPSPQ